MVVVPRYACDCGSVILDHQAIVVHIEENPSHIATFTVTGG